MGETVWVLIVNINPGGPNGGSATQYFTGRFDGHTFTPDATDTRWLDYGPDEYAGITWANTGNRKIFIGWMSNWQYANVVPTQRWRSAMTIPRDLSVEKVGDKYLLRSVPVPELQAITGQPVVAANLELGRYDLTEKAGKLTQPAKLHLTSEKIESFSITLSNTMGEKVTIGYNKDSAHYYIDRTRSGRTDFEKGFAGRHTAPRLTTREAVDLTLIIDNASVELFADSGLSVMTEIFFPNVPFTNIVIQSDKNFKITSLEYRKMKSMYAGKGTIDALR